MAEGFNQKAGRQKPARGVQVTLSGPNIVWATVCTKDRDPWLANEEAHQQLRSVWQAAQKWLVSDYIIMPDHLHFFAAPTELDYSFDNWVTYWERQFRKLHKHETWRWQSHPFHHRLRNGESYTEKWHYLRNNPVRKGLVINSDDWPFQGRIHEVRW